MENFLISKKLYSDIMEFKLQQMYSCEVVGKARGLYLKNE